jgi:hypothetical protein
VTTTTTTAPPFADVADKTAAVGIMKPSFRETGFFPANKEVMMRLAYMNAASEHDEAEKAAATRISQFQRAVEAVLAKTHKKKATLVRRHVQGGSQPRVLLS